jgi:TonB family protein
MHAWHPTLAAAIAASAVVHAALITLPAWRGTAPADRTAVVLEARLAPHVDPQPPVSSPAADSPPPAPPVLSAPVRAPDAPAPEVLTAAPAAPPASDGHPSDALAEAAPAEVVAAPLDDPGEVRVAAQQVFALARLGDLFEREMNEFPREVQFPVRYQGTIEARYPAEARAQGIEGSVLAWVVVDPSANVEEIQIVEGAEIFREPVIEAIHAARFLSAADAGVGLHFPITLEFRFALDRPATAAVAAASPQPQDAAAARLP